MFTVQFFLWPRLGTFTEIGDAVRALGYGCSSPRRLSFSSYRPALELNVRLFPSLR